MVAKSKKQKASDLVAEKSDDLEVSLPEGVFDKKSESVTSQSSEPPLPNRPTVSIAIEELVLDPLNARKGKIGDLIESLKEFGQHRDAVVQEGTMKVIIGNHMVMAAQRLGWERIDCKMVDDDDITSIRRSLSDNRIGEKAEWHDDVLMELLDVAGSDIPGMDEKFLSQFADELLGTEEEAIEKSEPTYPIVPKFSESYEGITIFAKNEQDWLFLASVLDIGRAKSYKNEGVAQCHVMTAEQFRQRWESRLA